MPGTRSAANPSRVRSAGTSSSAAAASAKPAAPAAAAPVRRLVCVSLNAAIDKISAVERLVSGEIHRPELLSVVPGGKALNVARAAVGLGLDAVVVPVVGGHAGAWLVAALDAAGLVCRPVEVPGETRTCLTILDRSTGQLTEFYEAGLAARR